MNKDSHLIFEAYIANLREGTADISKYKNIIDKLSRGEFDTESQKELIDKGVKEGIFDVEVINGKRQVVLTNNAIRQIEQQYPELKDKFWECGKCKADYPGCGEAKREKSEEEEMPYPEFAKLSKHAASKLPEDKPEVKQEDEERRLDPKCWKGYHKAGTKLKDGVRVNKCVKNS